MSTRVSPTMHPHHDRLMQMKTENKSRRKKLWAPGFVLLSFCRIRPSTRASLLRGPCTVFCWGVWISEYLQCDSGETLHSLIRPQTYSDEAFHTRWNVLPILVPTNPPTYSWRVKLLISLCWIITVISVQQQLQTENPLMSHWLLFYYMPTCPYSFTVK